MTGHIQVGVGAGPVLRAFDVPEEVVEDARYDEIVAYWLTYRSWGIAFRVLLSPHGASR
ncbi:MAG: hypothetical protein ACRDF5_07905 [bacterium]